MEELKKEKRRLLEELNKINDKIRHYQQTCLHTKVVIQYEYDGHKSFRYYQCVDCDEVLNKIITY
jgi:hypothetical protein